MLWKLREAFKIMENSKIGGGGVRPIMENSIFFFLMKASLTYAIKLIYLNIGNGNMEMMIYLGKSHRYLFKF